MSKSHIIVAGIVIATLAGLAALWYAGASFIGKQEAKNQENQLIDAAASIKLASPITNTEVRAPKVLRKIVYPDYLDEDARRVFAANFETLSEGIEKDPTDIDNWLDLALRYKAIEDLEGAREVWQYLTLAAPKHGVSFYNLGYLYHISLKDYPASEDHYKKALEIDKYQESYYTGLHDLYRYSYKQDTTAAIDTLEEGIRQLPTSINLRLTLASYYRDDKKDKKTAIQWFTQARDLAKEQGNAQLVMSLDKEISALGK